MRSTCVVNIWIGDTLAGITLYVHALVDARISQAGILIMHSKARRSFEIVTMLRAVDVMHRSPLGEAEPVAHSGYAPHGPFFSLSCLSSARRRAFFSKSGRLRLARKCTASSTCKSTRYSFTLKIRILSHQVRHIRGTCPNDVWKTSPANIESLTSNWIRFMDCLRFNKK